MRRLRQLGALAFVAAALAHAQGLDRAEALWKAHRWQEANDAFRALVAAGPTNPDYRVRWGRLLLERFNPAEASALFGEALELKKDHAGANLGMALVAAQNFDGRAEDYAQKALAADPKLTEARELLARIALEDNDEAKAGERARETLALDSNSVQAKSILATIDWLNDKPESQWDPRRAEGYETAGHFFVINRRYEEGIAFYRKAIAADPQLWSARSQLGINLMRLGQEQEAYQELEACYKNGYTDSATVNSLRLIDSYKNFVTFRTPRTVLKLHKKEAELLRPYFEAEMERVISTFEKKYKVKLDRPVQVEVYPDHEDFAVRTLGMPGLGALGVTFGYVIAMDSPSGRKPGSFHWASTLWHEMSHVYTLTATGNRVPRWFTEGMAVYEETAVSPDWGDRLSPDVITAIGKKQLLPVAELDRGFVHPTRPTQVIVSYFQAGRICGYIADKWGYDKLLAMMHDYAAGADTSSVVRKELGIEPAEFDKRFLAQVEADTRSVVDHFEEWRKQLRQVADAAKARDHDTVIKIGTSIRDLYPDYVETGSVYEFLAEAYEAKKERKPATAELELYQKRGGRDPDSIKLLARYLEEAGRKADAAGALEKLNYVYPMEGDAHRKLGGLWLEQGNAAGAVREFQAALARNPIDQAAAHYDLARAYRMNRQPGQAKDELLAALEAAPGFRPAQKMLLELSGEEAAGTK